MDYYENDSAPKRLSDAAPRPLPQKIERDAQAWSPNARVRQGWAAGFAKAATTLGGLALLAGLGYVVFMVFKSYT